MSVKKEGLLSSMGLGDPRSEEYGLGGSPRGQLYSANSKGTDNRVIDIKVKNMVNIDLCIVS